MIDIVTVVHNAENTALSSELFKTLAKIEPLLNTFYAGDNRVDNIGFGNRCNLTARNTTTDIIGFLNPDIKVDGPFFHLIEEAFQDENVVIVGERFGLPWKHTWWFGMEDWVCGACFFVRRDWFMSVGGFDPVYVWGWEETDLCMLAQSKGLKVKSLELPVRHEQGQDNQADSDYKEKHMLEGDRYFCDKWGY